MRRLITFNGETLGAIGLSADLSEMREELASYGKIVASILPVSLGCRRRVQAARQMRGCRNVSVDPLLGS